MHMNVSGPWKEVLHKWLVKYVAEKAAMHLDARIIILGNPYTTALPVVKEFTKEKNILITVTVNIDITIAFVE